jgi:hypothetical protein
MMPVYSTLLECWWLGRKSDREKELETLLLRRLREIVARGRVTSLRLSQADKMTLVVVAARLKAVTAGR